MMHRDKSKTLLPGDLNYNFQNDQNPGVKSCSGGVKIMFGGVKMTIGGISLSHTDMYCQCSRFSDFRYRKNDGAIQKDLKVVENSASSVVVHHLK